MPHTMYSKCAVCQRERICRDAGDAGDAGDGCQHGVEMQ